MPLQQANLPALGLEPPQLEIAVTTEENETKRTVTFAVGNKVGGDTQEHYLKTSASPFLLTWPSHFVTPFERDVTELFDPAAPAPGEQQKDGDQPKEGEPGKQGDKDEAPAKEDGTPKDSKRQG